VTPRIQYLGSRQGDITSAQLPYPLRIDVAIAQGRPGNTVGTVNQDGSMQLSIGATRRS
jgi:hypothetical protein